MCNAHAPALPRRLSFAHCKQIDVLRMTATDISRMPNVNVKILLISVFLPSAVPL